MASEVPLVVIRSADRDVTTRGDIRALLRSAKKLVSIAAAVWRGYAEPVVSRSQLLFTKECGYDR